MQRTATCHCGSLTVRCQGDPSLIAMCHCELCQRRTGTSYNLSAWFARPDTSIQGDERVYRRTGDEGIEVRFHFCPTCGTSVYWEMPTYPDLSEMVGVAVGCFADPDFPPPTLSLYGKRRHKWLHQPTGMPSHTAGGGSELE